MKRIIAAILALVFSLVVITLITSYLTFKKSLPKTSGSVAISSLDEDVTVYRDDFGVPHIFAQNDQDLYFSLGYVMAQDRLWQLELARRLVNGRLSQVFGDTTVAIDGFFLTVGFRRIAEEIYEKASVDARKAAEAYTAGINHLIAERKGKYPIEFMLLAFEPEPWRPQDCFAISRLMAWELSLAWPVELLASRLEDKLGRSQTQDLFGDYWSNWPNIVSADLSEFDLDPFMQIMTEVGDFLGTRGLAQGSNNWVVSGLKSASGKPILANDPHLLLSNPSRWYLAHLSAPGVNAAGFTFPGAPAIAIGFNGRISWGITNAMADDVDFFVTEINSQDTTLYRTDSGWRKLNVIEESVPIKDAGPKTLKIKLTDQGPIINDIHPLKSQLPHRMAMRWTGQEATDDLSAFLGINRAGDWQAFRLAASQFKVPSTNMVYGDVDGNIGYLLTGSIPQRRTTGVYPSTSRSGWRGFIPPAQLPSVFNPESQFLASANNRIASADYPFYISHLWEPPSRIMRIRQLLQQDKKFSVDDFKAMQSDVRSPFAEFLIPVILPELKRMAEDDARFESLYQFMQGWDKEVRGESAAAGIFHVFFSRFLENVFVDEMGEDLFDPYLSFAALSYRAIRKIIVEERDQWFDDKRTPDRIETAIEIIHQTWLDTADELEAKLGSNPIRWRWDQLHRVTFRHFLGDQPMVGDLFNVGPFALGGSHTTINNGNYSLRDPYATIVGPSMRMIVDMAQPDRGHVINPPGQVGHPLSPHFRDQTDYWLNGLYITLETDPALIKNAGYDKLELRAAPRGTDP